MNIPDSTRLSYHFMTEKDKKLFYSLNSDPDVMRYISGGKTDSMDDIENQFLPRLASYANEAQGWGLWGVNSIIEQSFLGLVLARPMHFFSDRPQWDNIEIGWRFLQSAWGHGYATEAALALVHALKHKPHIHTISAIALEENHASINVMKKLGMHFVKKAIHQDPLGDEEVVFYEMPVSH